MPAGACFSSGKVKVAVVWVPTAAAVLGAVKLASMGENASG